MPKIAPSIIAADASKLSQEILDVIDAGADMLHLDVMDGAFVPNITFGPWITAGLRKLSNIHFDVHLMVEEPIRFLEDYQKAGADCLSVHVEACTHIHGTLLKIKDLGMQPGVAINPGTPLSALDSIIHLVDRIIVMGVNPGFAGQAFIPETIDRVKALSQVRVERGLQFEINVDGGASPKNASQLATAGADILVAGSAIFYSDDYASVIQQMK